MTDNLFLASYEETIFLCLLYSNNVRLDVLLSEFGRVLVFLLSRVCTAQGYLLEVVLSCSVGGISFEARLDLVSLSIVLPPTLNSQRYVHVSHKRLLFSLPFFISPNVVLIHDNVQPHSDAVVIYCHREVFYFHSRVVCKKSMFETNTLVNTCGA